MSCNIFCSLPQPHRTIQDDHFGTSYQQWLSSVEVRGAFRKIIPTVPLSNLRVPGPKCSSLPSPLMVPAHSPAPILSLLHPSPHQTLLTNHPPSHVLAALEHLATEREAEIRSLCSEDRLQDTRIGRCVVEYFHNQAG